MQDSNITYTVKAEGVEQAQAKFKELGATIKKMTFNQNGTVTATGKLSTMMDQYGSAADKATNATNRAAKAHQNYFAHIAQTTVQSAIINKLFLEFVNVAGQAIEAVDLMANFPATMASMGESTRDASEAMQALRTYVGQVGGNLQQATSMVTRFTGVTKDVKAATAVYTGLNNALIAGDSTVEEQKQSLLQFAQAFERGKPDMREWNSLTQNMSFQLSLVAKEMGYINANSLGQALRDGEESMAAFVTTLTEMSTGTGVIAQQAMTRMQGMQFAFNVLRNTMVTGLATIIQTIGRNNIVSFFTFMTQASIAAAGGVVFLINSIISLINVISRLLGGPQISNIAGDTEAAAAGLAAGAGAAGDMGKNLKDSKDDAKELKKSLASFDKMNVLTEPAGKKDDDAGAKGTVFDAGQLSKLTDAFGDIGGRIKEAGLAAKIFAGILGALAAGGILGKIFGVNPITAFANALKHPIETMGKVSKASDDMSKKVSKNLDEMGKAYEKGLLKGMDDGNKMKTTGANLASGLVSGFAGGLGGMATRLFPALVPALAAVGTAIATFVAGLSAVTVGLIVLAIAAVIAAIWLIYDNWDAIWSGIKKVSDVVWQGIQKGWDMFTQFYVDLWHGIYDVFSAGFAWIKEWGATFIAVLLFPYTLLLAGVILIMDQVVKFVRKSWEGLKLLFSIGAELLTEIFEAAVITIIVIWTALVSFFRLIWDTIVDIFSPVTTFFFDIFSKSWEGITLIWGLAGAYFGKIWSTIGSPFAGAGLFFGNIFLDAFNRITGVFSGLSEWFRVNVWNRIVNIFSSIGTSVGDAIGNAFRGVINTVLRVLANIYSTFMTVFNEAAGVINKVSPVKIKPLPRWDVPQLAQGGIINQPTMAMVGEAGAEAVVPLENNTEWIDKLARKINRDEAPRARDERIPSKLDAQQESNNITIHVSGVFATSVAEQRKVADLIAKRINESVGGRKMRLA